MNDCIDVTTQAELDAALARDDQPCIHLNGDGYFELSDSATVRAYGSATVRAYGSATVRAYGSATVSAYGSATVSAYDSATVRAYDSATVRAYGSATVRASQYTAIHQLSPRATITGTGHVITPPNLDGADTPTWLSYHGIEPDEDGVVTLFKAVDDNWTTDRGTSYAPGATPEAADWRPDASCGGGLHFGPTVVHAMAYHAGATKFVACPVLADEISVIDQQKVKAKRVVDPGCRQVDIDGRDITPAEPELADAQQ
jgi:hypothetical protein